MRHSSFYRRGSQRACWWILPGRPAIVNGDEFRRAVEDAIIVCDACIRRALDCMLLAVCVFFISAFALVYGLGTPFLPAWAAVCHTALGLGGAGFSIYFFSYHFSWRRYWKAQRVSWEVKSMVFK